LYLRKQYRYTAFHAPKHRSKAPNLVIARPRSGRDDPESPGLLRSFQELAMTMVLWSVFAR
jgi:hypothetical protein